MVQQIARLQETDFYGKVTLDIQGGNILRLMINRSIKIEEAPDVEASTSQSETPSFKDQEAPA
jgi:hypothetical protein